MFNILDIRFLTSVVKRLFYILFTESYKKKIILTFFNLDGPCDPGIKECTKLRQEYKNDVDKNSVNGHCKGCVLSFIRQIYINKILQSL